MTNQLLKNLHILITRPNPAGEELCELIRSHEGTALHFPTIAFTPPNDMQSFRETIQTIGEQDWLLFVSPQAVYASIPAIRQAWPNFPPQLSLAAIGGGTVKALQAAGYQSVTHPEVEWHSEGLLELPAFQSIAGKKIMLVRGEGGRDLLQQVFEERGARVSHLIAYQRVMPHLDVSQPVHYVKSNQLDAIVCMSFEGVKNLKTLLGDDAWPDLQNVPLLVSSERVKELAQGLGFQTIWVANNASQQAVIDALAQRRDELCQNKQSRIKQQTNSQLQ